MKLNIVVYTIHVICQDIDGGATEADGGASAPVGPSVATPLARGPLYHCRHMHTHTYMCLAIR